MRATATARLRPGGAGWPAARLGGPAAGIWLAALGVTLLGWIVVTARGGEFLTQPHVTGVLQNCVALGLIALGQTVVILTGSLDLSVAYLVSLGTLVAAETMASGTVLTGVFAVLLLSAAVGLANGLIVTRLKVHAFIATLGTALILRGWIEDNYTGPAGEVPAAFRRLGYDRIGPVPVSVFLLATRGPTLLGAGAVVSRRRRRVELAPPAGTPTAADLVVDMRAPGRPQSPGSSAQCGADQARGQEER